MTDSVMRDANPGTENRPDSLAGQKSDSHELGIETHASNEERERPLQIRSSVSATSNQLGFTASHRSLPTPCQSRLTRFKLSERSDVVSKKHPDVAEIDSHILKEMFGTGAQWTFPSDELKRAKYLNDIVAVQKQGHQAELTLTGQAFRAVMQSTPSWNVSDRFPGAPLTAIRMRTCTIRDWDWDKEELDGSHTTYFNARLEVQVEAWMKAWPETVKEPCYSEDTLDAGWPGSAKEMALSAATEPEPH